MRWSTLIIVIIAVVLVIGLVIFVIPWKDTITGILCSDVSYEHDEVGNVKWWWDPSTPEYKARRIVKMPSETWPGIYDWIFIDEDVDSPIGEAYFRIVAKSPEQLREYAESWHDQGTLPNDSWHWFDCTICATQGECP